VVQGSLTQFTTGHAYTGEYFKRFVKTNDTICTSHEMDPDVYPPVILTREHTICACPLFDQYRPDLRKVAPRTDRPAWNLGNLLRRDYLPAFLDFLNLPGALSKKHAPRKKKPPDKPSCSLAYAGTFRCVSTSRPVLASSLTRFGRLSPHPFTFLPTLVLRLGSLRPSAIFSYLFPSRINGRFRIVNCVLKEPAVLYACMYRDRDE
jgi:hypothetical protein